MNKQKTPLKWKTKTLSDKSGSWKESHISPLDWTYVIEDDEQSSSPKKYQAAVFFSGEAQEAKALHKGKKTLEECQALCQAHLRKTAEKLTPFLR